MADPALGRRLTWGGTGRSAFASTLAGHDDEMVPQAIATTTHVDLPAMLNFVRPRHRMILVTRRPDGSPQLSPVTGGVDGDGRVVISTYPERAKVGNLRRDASCSILVLSDEWNGPWLQVDGTAEVLDMPTQEPRTHWSNTFGASAASILTGTSTERQCAARASRWSASRRRVGARLRPGASRPGWRAKPCVC